jgi:hypothetical protein
MKHHLQSRAETDAYMGSTDLTNLMNLHDNMTPLSGHEGRVPTNCGVPEYEGGRFHQRHHSMVFNAILRSKTLSSA